MNPSTFMVAARASARLSVFYATSRHPILCEHQATEADECCFEFNWRCASQSIAAGNASLAAWLLRWCAAAVGLPEQCELALAS